MHITMVTRIMPNGAPCRKCDEAKQYLTQKGYWERIDEVVSADPTDNESPGVKLADEHGIDVAPFFIVTDGEKTEVFKSVVAFTRQILAAESP